MAETNRASDRLSVLHQRTEELFRRMQYSIAELPESDTRTQLHGLQIDLEMHHDEVQRTIDDQARQEAYRDALTRLPNRWLHMDHLQQCVRRAKRDPDSRYAVLFVGFDDFRMVIGAQNGPTSAPNLDPPGVHMIRDSTVTMRGAPSSWGGLRSGGEPGEPERSKPPQLDRGSEGPTSIFKPPAGVRPCELP